MKKKMFVIALAAAAAMASCTFAAPEETAPAGLYIANYAQTENRINLNIIMESDLLAAAQQAGTVIYHFRDDGTVELYDENGVTLADYEVQDGNLKISSDSMNEEFEYEFIDGQLILRNDAGASMLYGFSAEDLDHISMEDYSEITIDRANVEVTDETVNAYINSVLQGQTVYDQVTEGTVEPGDLITISFEGILEGETQPFEGGSAEGLTFMMGSGALIEGFEDQLDGREIGSTVEVNVTFPEDYEGNSELIGKNAVFTTTIVNKILAETPQLTDEWVQDFSGKYLPEQLETVDEFRQYSREYLGEYLLHTAMLNALAAKTTIDGYNSAVSQMLLEYSASKLSYNASRAGMDEASYVKAAGYSSPEQYEQAEALSYLNISMIVNKVLADQGILYTSQEFDDGLAAYLRLSANPYSPEEYKQQAGTADLWIYTNLEYKYNLAMDALEDRVVLTEQQESQEETQAPADE